MVRSSADRCPQRDDNLIWRWSVEDGELDRQVVRPHSLIRLVHQRNNDRAVRAAAGVGEGEIALRAYRFAIVIAEPEGVNEGGRVLHLSGGAHNRGLAIAFDGLASAR